jgi:lysozyme family protein
MATIKPALEKTLKYEGGYSDHAADAGGETICGIARNMWEKWEGWIFVDNIKSRNPSASKKEITSLANELLKNQAFMALVEKFYKVNFWDKLALDGVASQRIAENMFDFGVNSGTQRAAKYIQRLVGAAEDGNIGPKTIALINNHNSDELLTSYKKARLGFVNKIVEKNPTQSVFLNGWTKRIETA